ncbi:MAG: hypothetical protein KA371_02715 [Acidobacteria bacterium]|nr:hypothetical protein [Acidobacteriota bacterium]
MTSHASYRLAVSCLVAALSAVPGTSFAQSLADVARESTATRTEQRKPVKVYTNDNLKTDITPSSPVASSSADDLTSPDASGAMTPADGGAPADAASSGPATDARDQRSKDEAAWRARINAARESLDRSTSFASALQTQINSLTTDFVSRDDPAQRAQIEQQRLKAVAELERTQREIESNRKAIAAIEDEARKAGVPAGWLRS